MLNMAHFMIYLTSLYNMAEFMLYLTCQHGRFYAIVLHISYTHVCKPGLIHAISYIPYFLHEVNMADSVL